MGKLRKPGSMCMPRGRGNVAAIAVALVAYMLAPLAARALDLSSDERTHAATSSGSIVRDGQTVSVSEGQMLTAAEALALTQGAAQTLVLGANGSAIGGTFNLNNSVLNLPTLVIPTGVTGLGITSSAADVSQTLNVSGILNISGALTFNNAQSTISASNIFVNQGATLGNLLGNLSLFSPGSLFNAGSITSGGNLAINVGGDISNSGLISSAGSLQAIAGGSIMNTGALAAIQSVTNMTLMTSNLVNSGLISSMANINFMTNVNEHLSINNAGGRILAENGLMNFRDASFLEKIHIEINGGDLLARELNFHSGTGAVRLNVGDIGKINIYAGEAYVASTAQNLVFGDMILSGDPTIVGAGNVTLAAGALVFGEDLTVVAGGDILPNGGGTPLITVAGNLVLVAGANITDFGGVSGIVTFNGGSAAGGNILLSQTSLDVNGSITMTAFADGGGAQGAVQVASAGGGETIQLTAGNTLTATAGASAGTAISLGPINLNGSNIDLRVATPGGGPVSYDFANGAHISGVVTAGTKQGGAISTGTLSNVGNISMSAGGSISTQTSGAINNVTIDSGATVNFTPVGNVATGAGALTFTNGGGANTTNFGTAALTGNITFGTGALTSNGTGGLLVRNTGDINMSAMTSISSGGILSVRASNQLTLGSNLTVGSSGLLGYPFFVGAELSGNTIMFPGGAQVINTNNGLNIWTLGSLSNLNNTQLTVNFTNTNPGGDFSFEAPSFNNFGGGSITVNHAPTAADYYTYINAFGPGGNLQLQNVTVNGGAVQMFADDGFVQVQGQIVSNSLNPLSNGVLLDSGRFCAGCANSRVTVLSGAVVRAEGGNVVLAAHNVNPATLGPVIQVQNGARVIANGRFDGQNPIGGGVGFLINSGGSVQALVNSARQNDNIMHATAGNGTLSLPDTGAGITLVSPSPSPFLYGGGMVAVQRNGVAQFFFQGGPDTAVNLNYLNVDGGAVQVDTGGVTSANAVSLSGAAEITAFLPYQQSPPVVDPPPPPPPPPPIDPPIVIVPPGDDGPPGGSNPPTSTTVISTDKISPVTETIVVPVKTEQKLELYVTGPQTRLVACQTLRFETKRKTKMNEYSNFSEEGEARRGSSPKKGGDKGTRLAVLDQKPTVIEVKDDDQKARETIHQLVAEGLKETAQSYVDLVYSNFFNAGPDHDQYNDDLPGLRELVSVARGALSPGEFKNFALKLRAATSLEDGGHWFDFSEKNGNIQVFGGGAPLLQVESDTPRTSKL